MGTPINDNAAPDKATVLGQNANGETVVFLADGSPAPPAPPPQSVEKYNNWLVNLAGGTGGYGERKLLQEQYKTAEEYYKARYGIYRDVNGWSYEDYDRMKLEQAMIKRMNTQDLAVLFLLLGIYLATLLFSAQAIYKMSARNNTSVSYFSDPRFHPFG